MEWCFRKRARDAEEAAAPAAAAPSSGGGGGGSSSSSSSSAAAGTAAAGKAELLALLGALNAQLTAERVAARACASAARAGTEAERAFARSFLARDAALAAALAERDELLALVGGAEGLKVARLGERLIDVIGIVAAVGFACEVSHCLYLCSVTYRKGDKGATNDMIARRLELQCRLSETRERIDVFLPPFGTIRGATQLIIAVMLNNMPRTLKLVQLGEPLELREESCRLTALQWACSLGHEHVARVLLDGKYEGRGAHIAASCEHGKTPLIIASRSGREGVVRLLLARGAQQDVQDSSGWTALHFAIGSDGDGTDHSGIVMLLCNAAGAAASFALEIGPQGQHLTPLTWALQCSKWACANVLRSYGAR